MIEYIDHCKKRQSETGHNRMLKYHARVVKYEFPCKTNMNTSLIKITIQYINIDHDLYSYVPKLVQKLLNNFK